MKKIECIVSFPKFGILEKALRNHGIGGLTTTEVKGYGNEQTRPESYLLLPKIKMEIYCRDEELEELIDVICSVCGDEQLGAGKITVYDIKDIIRLRTREHGEAAV